MNNISLNKELLKLKIGEWYFVIDALYLNDVKNGLFDIDVNILSIDIRRKIFPYTETPFAEFRADEIFFGVKDIKKVHNSEEVEGSSYFSSDTGLLVVINKKILIEFIGHFDYEKLVDSPIDAINKKYWDSITSKFIPHDVGLILSPGTNSACDFDGSGTYRIV